MPPQQEASGPSLAAHINAALPQTQCTRCGYPDCASYAQAIATEGAAINQCPPGGAEGVARLARLTGQAIAPLNAENGVEAPLSLVVIDESWCIGCTLCIQACPTDAILGANKRMHTVIAAHCTGCALCLPVCPVDCIHLHNASGVLTGWDAWSPEQAQHAQQRYQHRQTRLAQTQNGIREPTQLSNARSGPSFAAATGVTCATEAQERLTKQSVITAALAKARAQRA